MKYLDSIVISATLGILLNNPCISDARSSQPKFQNYHTGENECFSSNHRLKLHEKTIIYAGHIKKIRTCPNNSKGAISATGVRETVYNDKFVRTLEHKLKGSVEFVYTKKNLHYMERTKYAKKHRAKLYIEIHHDTGSDEDVKKKRWKDLRGFSIFIAKANSKYDHCFSLAKDISESLMTKGFKPMNYYKLQGKTDGTPIREQVYAGIYNSEFYVLKQEIPAIILEVGNIANPYEEKKMRNKKFIDTFSDAVLIGLSKYESQRLKRPAKSKILSQN